MADTQIELAHPKQSDVHALLADIRDIDAREIRAVIGDADPAPRIWEGLQRADVAASVWLNGELFGLGGVSAAALLGDIWCPWFLATKLADEYPSVIVRLGKLYMPRIMMYYPKMENFVHAENKKAIRWLKSVGFKVDPAVPYGRQGELFHHFHSGGSL